MNIRSSAAPTKRSAFTEDEDHLLVKYIAVYAPRIPGRLGNKLYKDHVENVDKKWSWSEHHTWQSWRERYKKKQDWFNHKILEYQKRKNLPRQRRTVTHLIQPKPNMEQTSAAEGETGDEAEGRMCKRKLSDVRSGQGKRAKHGRPPSPVEKRPGATTKRRNHPRPPPEEEDEPGRASRLSRQNNNDDPFGTPPPTPVRSQPAAKPKRPPVLVDSGFRTAFSNSRRFGGGSDSHSSVEFVEPKKTWPPQRNKGVTTLSKTRADPGA